METPVLYFYPLKPMTVSVRVDFPNGRVTEWYPRARWDSIQGKRAMLETWRDSWFEEGMRVFYILPRATVDTLLPFRSSPHRASWREYS